MSDANVSGGIHLGFLTVFPEASGYVGGYLVTNSWGRPIEFRLSSAVQPNKVQQILYASTLPEYLCADLIGKTLVEKTATPVQLLVTDSLQVLSLRSRLDIPIVAVVPEVRVCSADRPCLSLTHARSSMPLTFEAISDEEEAKIVGLLDRLDSALELTEPFARIRDAMSEARKIGASSRAA